MIRATPLLDSLAAVTPFVGPEALARVAGFDEHEVLRLGANESGFGPSPYAVSALASQLTRANEYGDPENFELRAALAEKHGCDAAEIVVGAGIDDLIGMFIRAYVAPGQTILTTSGTYPTLFYHAAGYGAKVTTVPYGAGKPDIDALTSALSAGPRLLYIANPDNPSGGYHGPAAMTQLVRALPAQTLLLLDEAYAEYLDAADEPLIKIHPNVVRLRTFSKAFGLAGLRVGYALAARETLATCEKIRLHFGVGRLAQTAALAALSQPSFVQTVVRETSYGRIDYEDLAADNGLTTFPSATNFVLFELKSQARAEEFVKTLFAKRIFIRKPLAGPLATCVRITVGTRAQRERLAQDFAEALAEASAPQKR